MTTSRYSAAVVSFEVIFDELFISFRGYFGLTWGCCKDVLFHFSRSSMYIHIKNLLELSWTDLS